jgi:hypothetical protein
LILTVLILIVVIRGFLYLVVDSLILLRISIVRSFLEKERIVPDGSLPDTAWHYTGQGMAFWRTPAWHSGGQVRI